MSYPFSMRDPYADYGRFSGRVNVTRQRLSVRLASSPAFVPEA